MYDAHFHAQIVSRNVRELTTQPLQVGLHDNSEAVQGALHLCPNISFCAIYACTTLLKCKTEMLIFCKMHVYNKKTETLTCSTMCFCNENSNHHL